MNTLEIIKSRRSIRKYQDIPVEEELIEKVIEAGRYAPSGGNSQSTHFIVISNKEALNTIAQIAREEFAKMDLYEGIYRSLAGSIIQSKKGNYIFHYNAPVLVLLANQKEYGNNMADCVCALENMLIAANSLELGSCYINQINWLNENEAMLEYLYSLGLKENERVYASLVFGYAQDLTREPLERKGNEVTYIK